VEQGNSLFQDMSAFFPDEARNRRRRFGLRLNLIAGLLNYELAHPFLIHAGDIMSDCSQPGMKW
jgi:hypothetical protein